jgi:hypothetical protein
MSDPSLNVYTVEQLTEFYESNRASVLNRIVRDSYATILELVGIGKREFPVDHVYLHSEWSKDEQFRNDLVSALQGYFPGSTITMFIQEPNDYCISFSYTPTE